MKTVDGQFFIMISFKCPLKSQSLIQSGSFFLSLLLIFKIIYFKNLCNQIPFILKKRKSQGEFRYTEHFIFDLLYTLYLFLLSKYHVSLISNASGNTHVCTSLLPYDMQYQCTTGQKPTSFKEELEGIQRCKVHQVLFRLLYLQGRFIFTNPWKNRWRV